MRVSTSAVLPLMIADLYVDSLLASPLYHVVLAAVNDVSSPCSRIEAAGEHPIDCCDHLSFR